MQQIMEMAKTAGTTISKGYTATKDYLGSEGFKNIRDTAGTAAQVGSAGVAVHDAFFKKIPGLKPPKVEKPPVAPVSDDEEAERELQKRRARRAAGRQSTILSTGGLG